MRAIEINWSTRMETQILNRRLEASSPSSSAHNRMIIFHLNSLVRLLAFCYSFAILLLFFCYSFALFPLSTFFASPQSHKLARVLHYSLMQAKTIAFSSSQLIRSNFFPLARFASNSESERSLQKRTNNRSRSPAL